VSFLSDEWCWRVPVAMEKAVLYGVGGGLWGVQKALSMEYGAGDGIEGMVIGSP
jgi:hypothetical protein